MRLMPIAVLAAALCAADLGAQAPTSRPERLPAEAEKEVPEPFRPTHVDLPAETRPASRPKFTRRTKGDAQLVASMSRVTYAGESIGVSPVQYVSISVFDDGTLEYVGEKGFVRVVGKRAAKLSDATMQGVLDLFHRARWFELQDRYARDGYTGPPHLKPELQGMGCTLTFQSDGRAKTIEHYPAGMDRPVELDALEKEFDRLVETERWAGSKHRRADYDDKWRPKFAMWGEVKSVSKGRVVISMDEDTPHAVVGREIFVRDRDFWFIGTLKITRVREEEIEAAPVALEAEAEIKVGDRVFGAKK